MVSFLSVSIEFGWCGYGLSPCFSSVEGQALLEGREGHPLEKKRGWATTLLPVSLQKRTGR
jgi:hypothetical protein